MSDSEMPKAYESSAVEEKWYSYWENNGLFHGKPNPDKKPYSIVIPPPNVTGILTMGHVLNNTLQDILARWHRMEGDEVCWFPGTDHAGIATESRVEKYLREKEGTGRDELGREEFVKRVWTWREQYGGTIIRQLRNSAHPATGSASVSPWTKGSATPSNRFLYNCTTRDISNAASA